jgi:non-ribosomal peptide synthetase component F
VQLVRPAQPVALAVQELATLAPAEQEARLGTLLREDAARPFVLEREGSLRASLYRLGEQRHVLLLMLHHIAADGWSVGILLRELAALYRAFATDVSAGLAPLPLQYADYACWQRTCLDGGLLEPQLSWWEKRLTPLPPPLELPADRPRPAVEGTQGARLSFALPEELARGLKALAQREGVTLYTVLLSGFSTLLYRYSGQADLIIGSPVANRRQEVLEPLIGFFSNTLALRLELSGDPDFLGLLRRVQRMALESFTHQEAPFDRVVQRLRAGQQQGAASLVRVAFALQNSPLEVLELHGLRVSPMEVEGTAARFDLSLSMSERAGVLGGLLEYRGELFDRERMERLLLHLRTLLESVAAHPTERLSTLQYLSAEEREALLAWSSAGGSQNYDLD